MQDNPIEHTRHAIANLIAQQPSYNGFPGWETVHREAMEKGIKMGILEGVKLARNEIENTFVKRVTVASMIAHCNVLIIRLMRAWGETA